MLGGVNACFHTILLYSVKNYNSTFNFPLRRTTLLNLEKKPVIYPRNFSSSVSRWKTLDHLSHNNNFYLHGRIARGRATGQFQKGFGGQKIEAHCSSSSSSSTVIIRERKRERKRDAARYRFHTSLRENSAAPLSLAQYSV